MQKLELNNGRINGWYCNNCKCYWDILTIICSYCNEIRDDSLATLAHRIECERNGILHQIRELTMADKQMTIDEYFTRWNSEAALAIADMNESQMTEWRNEMAMCEMEAKLKRSYADSKLREKKAKAIQAGKPWLVPSDNIVDESVVKTRKERMSKEAKLLAMMKDLGVEGADEIINKVAHKQNSSVTSSTERVLVDKVNIQPSSPKSVNTQESLLSDLSDSIINGINDRPIDDIVNAVKTAGHIANRLLSKESSVTIEPHVIINGILHPNPVKISVTTNENETKDEPFDFSKLGE